MGRAVHLPAVESVDPRLRHQPELDQSGHDRFMSEQLERLQDDDPHAALRYQWVPYAKISRHAKRALLAAGDARFTEHDGTTGTACAWPGRRTQKKGIVAGEQTDQSAVGEESVSLRQPHTVAQSRRGADHRDAGNLPRQTFL